MCPFRHTDGASEDGYLRRWRSAWGWGVGVSKQNDVTVSSYYYSWFFASISPFYAYVGTKESSFIYARTLSILSEEKKTFSVCFIITRAVLTFVAILVPTPALSCSPRSLIIKGVAVSNITSPPEFLKMRANETPDLNWPVLWCVWCPRVTGACDDWQPVFVSLQYSCAQLSLSQMARLYILHTRSCWPSG